MYTYIHTHVYIQYVYICTYIVYTLSFAYTPHTRSFIYTPHTLSHTFCLVFANSHTQMDFAKLRTRLAVCVTMPPPVMMGRVGGGHACTH